MKNNVLLILLAASAVISCGAPKIVAMQPSDPVVPQMPPPPKEPNTDRIAQGKVLFEDRCANCHKLFSPTEFTKPEWAPILTRMQPKARLDNEQMALVSDYIYSLAPL